MWQPLTPTPVNCEFLIVCVPGQDTWGSWGVKLSLEPITTALSVKKNIPGVAFVIKVRLDFRVHKIIIRTVIIFYLCKLTTKLVNSCINTRRMNLHKFVFENCWLQTFNRYKSTETLEGSVRWLLLTFPNFSKGISAWPEVQIHPCGARSASFIDDLISSEQ